MEFIYEGKKVFYKVQGEGPDLLLLHGWGCTGDIFASFVPALSATHRVISIDFPGFGGSEEPEGVWGVEDYTRMLEAFCDSLSIVRPSIVCHSFGGRVSILFATRREVSRMIFCGAAGIKPKRPLKYYIKVYSYKLSKWFLLKVLHNQAAFEKMRSGRGSADYNSASPKMKAILSKVVNEDLSALLPSIKAPVLLFWGENDTATPIADAKKMEKMIPDAGLVVVPGGTHFSFLEAPGLFLSVAQNFLG